MSIEEEEPSPSSSSPPLPDPPPLPFHAERQLHMLDKDCPRQQVFDHYKNGANPTWGITVRIDVTAVRKVCRAQKWSYLQASVFLYALTCNQYEPMRYRIRTRKNSSSSSSNDKKEESETIIICHEKIHPSVTVMRHDGSETYGFVPLNASLESFGEFRAFAEQMLDYFHNHTTGLGFLKGSPRDDMTFGSVLPWIDFTSYQHADASPTSDVSLNSVPKYVFGRLVHDTVTDTWSQAFCLHVHHGLMDGLHVGRFLEKFQANLDNAEVLLST